MHAQEFRWSNLFSFTLPASAAAMLIAGVLAWRPEFVPAGFADLARTVCLVAFAVLGASAIGAASCMFSHASAARAAGKAWRHVMVPALLFGAGFALASAIGVHIGWEVLTKPNLASMSLPSSGVVVAASLFLALGKPMLAWVVEGRRQIAQAAANAEIAEAKAEAKERETRDSEERKLRLVGGGTAMAIGAAAALAGAGSPPPAPMEYPTHETQQAGLQTRGMGASREVDRVRISMLDDAARAELEGRARVMLAAEMPLRVVERETGLHRDVLRRIRSEIETAQA